jgi:DNA-binding HxlR family transcriptional regulator
MPTTRSYGDACPIARALDLIGERWALLVVRELLFGAQRFSDLRRALPSASTNMLTDRLRELEVHGPACRLFGVRAHWPWAQARTHPGRPR